MFKNKIYKYFTIEIIKSFLIILFALSTVAWTVRAVSFLDLVVENAHSIKTYLLFSLLNITNIITKFAPLSFSLALILTILKFEKQNELLILWTNGLSKIKLVNLFFLISLLAVVFQLIFATLITPNALNKSRSLIRNSDFNSLASIIRINNFSDSFKSLIFYIEKKNDNNVMENIFIRDESNTFSTILSNNGKSKNTTIIAKTGVLNNNNLILYDGVMQSIDDENKLNNIYFTKTVLSAKSLAPHTIKDPKIQETKTSVLLNCVLKNSQNIIFKKLPNCKKNNLNVDIFSALLRRIGMPIYIPLVSIIYCFILISNKEKKYNFFYKYIYFVVGFVVLVMAEVLVRFSGFSKLYFLTYIFFPFIFIPITYLILKRKLLIEKKR